jgi:hypothetical protein
MAVVFFFLALGSDSIGAMFVWMLASALWFTWGVLGDPKAQNVPVKAR